MSEIICKQGLASYTRQAAVFTFDYFVVYLILEIKKYFFYDEWERFWESDTYNDVMVFAFIYFFTPMILFQGRTFGMQIFNIEVRRNGKKVTGLLNLIRGLVGSFIFVIGVSLWTLSALFDKKWPFDPIFQCHMYYKNSK